MVKYVMLGAATISFLIGIITEFTTNPLKLPGWARLFGLTLMMAPMILSFVGLCVKKETLMCCLYKHTAKQKEDDDKVETPATKEKKMSVKEMEELEI